MKIAVTGSSGQLGSELQELARSSNHEFRFFDENDLDITSEKAIASQLQGKNYNLIINAAAYTQVDAAEANEDRAYQVNALGPKLLCETAQNESAKVLHISTDFVFDGRSNTPYEETAQPNPLSAYGRTKLAGENLCLKSGLATVIRTSWVYSTYGKNFVKSILRKLETGDELRVVDDQIGRPTYARNLALFIFSHLEPWSRIQKSELFHFSDGGSCSWYDFACKIRDLSGFKNSILRIKSSDLQLPAKRPHYSCLDLSKTQSQFAWSPEPWESALSQMLKGFKTSL